MKKRYRIIEMYKSLSGAHLLPTGTRFAFWSNTYETNPAVYDREFARRYKDFFYDDFMEAEELSMAKMDLIGDVLSILTFNSKKYEEMYRVFLVTNDEDPITYNYDLTETTGKQKQTNTKGEQNNTIGSHTDTIGSQTNTHSVAPYNDSTYAPESQDVAAERQDTIGSHTDTEGARTDIIENDEWTLTRRGNIGVQTAGDMLRIHTEYWTNTYKFLDMIFEDIRQQLLLVGDC